MKVHIRKSKASVKRHEELNDKVIALFEEYKDVPFFVANRMQFFDCFDDVMFDFTQDPNNPSDKKKVAFIAYCKLVKTKKNEYMVKLDSPATQLKRWPKPSSRKVRDE